MVLPTHALLLRQVAQGIHALLLRVTTVIADLRAVLRIALGVATEGHPHLVAHPVAATKAVGLHQAVHLVAALAAVHQEVQEAQVLEGVQEVVVVVAEDNICLIKES